MHALPYIFSITPTKIIMTTPLGIVQYSVLIDKSEKHSDLDGWVISWQYPVRISSEGKYISVHQEMIFFLIISMNYFFILFTKK